MAGAEAYLRAMFHLDPSNRLVTYTNITDRIDRQDRQDRTEKRSDSIERTVLQTVAPKLIISPIRPQASHGRICTKFGTAVGVADVSCDKLFGDRLRGADSVENCHFPLTKPVAVNTGLALPRSL